MPTYQVHIEKNSGNNPYNRSFVCFSDDIQLVKKWARIKHGHDMISGIDDIAVEKVRELVIDQERIDEALKERKNTTVKNLTDEMNRQLEKLKLQQEEIIVKYKRESQLIEAGIY